MMKDLRKRFSVASLFIFIAACLVVFAYQPFFQYVVVGLIALLTVIAIWEYKQFAKAKGGQMTSPVLGAIAIVEVFSFYIAQQFPFLQGLPGVIFFLGFLILYALHFRRKDGALVDLAVSSFGLLYIAVPMGMLIGILYIEPRFAIEDGRWWVAYLVIVTKITDIGAYFGGNLWGKRKLAPRISPGKTIEGAVVGLACAIFASFSFYWLSIYLDMSSFQLGRGEWLFLGFILGVVGQFGDLSESLLKRDANKKDSNALPGLGGALDSIDSLLFNAPIIYFYLQYVRL